MYYLGFDIGGSEIKVALVKDKKIMMSVFEKTSNDLDGMMLALDKTKNELIGGIKTEEIGGAGFSMAGAMDVSRSTMLNSPNIGYLNNQPIKEIFEKKMAPWPVKIEHDVHCFLLAEKETGLAKDMKSVFYLTVGTGVGGAFMIDGKIYTGAHGASGEVGHAIIDKNNSMSLENLTANAYLKSLLGIPGDEAEKSARSGNQKAKEVFDDRAKNLGIGIASIINIFDPEAVIIGGGVVSAKDLVTPGIKEMISKFVISSEARKTPVLFSQLGKFGGALGAALLFEQDHE